MTNLTLEEIGRRAKTAEAVLRVLPAGQKNKVLITSADYLVEYRELLLEANEKDVETAKEHQMPPALVDRLLLTEERIAQMAEGLRQISELEDPVGEVLSMKRRPNGLMIGQKRVPLGVIGIIYESRPNVTADAFGLCFKAGNAVPLRFGIKNNIHRHIKICRFVYIHMTVSRTGFNHRYGGMFHHRTNQPCPSSWNQDVNITVQTHKCFCRFMAGICNK